MQNNIFFYRRNKNSKKQEQNFGTKKKLYKTNEKTPKIGNKIFLFHFPGDFVPPSGRARRVRQAAGLVLVAWPGGGAPQPTFGLCRRPCEPCHPPRRAARSQRRPCRSLPGTTATVPPVAVALPPAAARCRGGCAARRADRAAHIGKQHGRRGDRAVLRWILLRRLRRPPPATGFRRLTLGSRVSVVSLVIPYSSPFFRKKIPENS